ncbi:hypothetical protein Moror_16496 [Moniliophthora roreri MCA 2997]|uniref:Uncharacterized protein n=1 Tax=Moniliophthora roreri (strain MCA 2997) TaxID=1381753 RepID=V2WVH2_MONRO|nr:hypothetical protein Moror_16496 [Moniliophthora roreri MCA 2997]
MAFSSEVERQRYSQQLAEYTLRQFSAARISMDNDELAAAKLPASHRHNYIKYARSLGKTSSQQHCGRSTNHQEPTRQAIRA